MANPGQKIITALHQRVAKTAMDRRIGHTCIRAGATKQHEIQPHFRVHASFGVPLPEQQTLEANQRIVTLRPDPGAPQPAFQYR